MDRLLFGDNQFFGVNHMSEEKARAQAMRFQDTRAIIEVLDTAYDAGIKTFMCTTHDRISEVCDHWRANPVRYKDYEFFPCMPYAHKYANAMTDYGMLGASVRPWLAHPGMAGHSTTNQPSSSRYIVMASFMPTSYSACDAHGGGFWRPPLLALQPSPITNQPSRILIRRNTLPWYARVPQIPLSLESVCLERRSQLSAPE